MSILFKHYKDNKFDFINSLELYEFLSILTVVYSGFIYYGDATMDAYIANCSFDFIIETSQKLIEESYKFPIYFLKVIFSNIFYFEYFDR